MAAQDLDENAITVLQQKLARDAKRQARERYFAWRIVPLLAMWAALVSAIKIIAFNGTPIAVVLTGYFAGAACCVVWLARRARRHTAER